MQLGNKTSDSSVKKRIGKGIQIVRTLFLNRARYCSSSLRNEAANSSKIFNEKKLTIYFGGKYSDWVLSIVVVSGKNLLFSKEVSHKHFSSFSQINTQVRMKIRTSNVRRESKIVIDELSKLHNHQGVASMEMAHIGMAHGTD